MLGRAATGSLPNHYRPGVLEFRILGPLAVVSENGPIRLGGPKQRATLAILLLSANRVVSVERLADDLYAGAAPVTAVTQVQRQISELRKALGDAAAIETRAPGYIVRVDPEQLDLSRFERRAAAGARALARGHAEAGGGLLREALSLWRGEPLADLAYERFAQSAVRRLDEIRLAALERRLEADLALGRHAEIAAELAELVAAHPLRERFSAQLMLALYRSGRQAEALAVYRQTRATLAGEFGIEPTPALRDLERAILRHDSSLEPARAASESRRAVLVVLEEDDETLLELAATLAAQPERELIVAQLVDGEQALEGALAATAVWRDRIAAPLRTATFTTFDRTGDTVRLAAAFDVDLVLLAPSEPGGAEVAALLERTPADVALLERGERGGDGVFVLLSGGDHGWAALELGAWLARAGSTTLTLVERHGDARRVEDASLAVERVVGIRAKPRRVESDDELGAVLADAALVVAAGKPGLVDAVRAPLLLVHRGLRPGGLAPSESRTQFSWSVDA